MRAAIYFPWWAVLWLLLSGQAVGDLSTCIEATCRVRRAGGYMGTGCAFSRTDSTLYVLTCQHVVGQDARCTVEFWYRGHQGRPLQATVEARSQRLDAAVLAVPLRQFGSGPVPPIVPIASRLDPPVVGETVTSVGCALGAWATAWKGHVIGYRGTRVWCRPPAAGGRSGSAVFDEAGTKIVGIIQVRDDQHGATGVMPVHFLYDEFGFQRSPRGQQTQCNPVPPMDEWFRGRQPRQQPQPGGGGFSGDAPWKSLPPDDQAPEPKQETPPRVVVPDPIDMGATNQRLDAIAQAIRESKPAATPQAQPSQAVLAKLEAIDRAVAEGRTDLSPVTRQLDDISATLDAVAIKTGAVEAQTEAMQKSLLERIGAALSPSALAGGVRDAVKGVLAKYGLVGGLSATVLAVLAGWWVLRKLRGYADEIAKRIDWLTDKIPGDWDDQLIDPMAYRVAEMLGGDDEPAPKPKATRKRSPRKR
jgi:hypothetical protein